ncbi:MAG TPA: SHOCT domain-containing protein [Dyella sp.]|nr:SHOCT domain-containing protein [Dyella sp.]
MDEPLTSSDHAKVLIFFLLMIPLALTIVGILPILFIVFGLILLKKNEDFSSVEVSVRVFKSLIAVALIIGVLGALYWGSTYGGEANTIHYEWGDRWMREGEFVGFMLVTVAAFIYLVCVQKLFLNPLLKHRGWVQRNGIFSNDKKLIGPSRGVEVNIINGEKLRSYSVADELIKWAKLRDDGIVTEEDFENARRKILKSE